MHPVILEVFGFPLKSYGLFITLGFAAGIALAAYRAKRRGLDPNEIMNMATLVIAAAIVGSRLLYVAVNPAQFIERPVRILFVQEGGLVFLGGLLAVIPVISWYLLRYRLDYLLWADLMFPSVPLGHIFGRTGCFLNGCCHGHPTESWWGVVFPVHGDGVARTPTQLFEAFANLAILLLLLAIDRRKPREGLVFSSYILLYSAWRFGIEFVRGDDRGALVLGMPVSQTLSLAGILVGLAFTAWLLAHPSPADAAPPPVAPGDPAP